MSRPTKEEIARSVAISRAAIEEDSPRLGVAHHAMVALADDLAEARALLEEIEWEEDAAVGKKFCPVCRSFKSHDSECMLAAFLAKHAS